MEHRQLRDFIDGRQHLYTAADFVDRAFDDVEYARRLGELRRRLRAAGVDVAVVTAPDTMAWLHGYRSRWYRHHSSTTLPPTQCTVVHATEDPVFMIEVPDHIGLVRATSVVEDIRAVPVGNGLAEPTLDEYLAFLPAQLAEHGWRDCTVGLELWSCLPNPAITRRIEAALHDTGCRTVDVSVPLRRARCVKSEVEIAKLERAQHACDAGLAALRTHVTADTTELQAWALYMNANVGAGGEPAALHETIASGPLMPSLHRISSRRPLGAETLFHADVAGVYDGYHVRTTRPYFIGAAPRELHDLTGVAAGAYDVLRTYGRVGNSWGELTARLNEYHAKTGLGGGACGYELGLSVPPADWVGELTWGMDESVDSPIEAGTVTDVETWNTVALVDTVVFTDDGPRFLSALAPELQVADR
ncbi:M24 family metallopeptidase [Embleya hyalina]|uniref:Xaa-Pro aminopeptidase n=1 Tax=Embleya hyalina TaxID=516124 RepID=A0A401Z4Q2_9ACTN|nr:M24 family metallopeptidase [Embleya hyalina]GCE01818.1 Xaa-Pro aminopeptidase [Embleya hyalina]